MQTGCGSGPGGQGNPPTLQVQGFPAPVQMVPEVGQGCPGLQESGDSCGFGGKRAGSVVGLVLGFRPRKAQVRIGLEGPLRCLGPAGVPCEADEGIGDPGCLCSLTALP